MGQHSIDRRRGVDPRRIGGGFLIGALASGALAVGALGTAGEAQASCVSAGGWFKIGNGCETSKLGDFALAIGPGATASANGGFNNAFAIGAGASAAATGRFNSATAKGVNARAEAIGGYNNTAIAIGDAADGGGSGDPQAAKMIASGAYASAGNGFKKLAVGSEAEANHGNTAIAIGSSARSNASGVYSTATALGTGAMSNARGIFNRAFAVGTQAGAWAVGGKNNTAIAIGNATPVGDEVQAERAIGPRLLTTRAAAGNVDVLDERAALAREGSEASGPGDNNTAISIGNGSTAGAGNGSNNYASVLGNRSVAGAFGGNWNRAFVFGNESRAVAGAVRGRPTTEAQQRLTAAIQVEQGHANTAIVAGNNSQAFAGPGLANLAKVLGNRSSAAASGIKQRVVSIGNDVHKPKETKDDSPATE